MIWLPAFGGPVIALVTSHVCHDSHRVLETGAPNEEVVRESAAIAYDVRAPVSSKSESSLIIPGLQQKTARVRRPLSSGRCCRLVIMVPVQRASR
jgi:hypothetical protein